MCATISFSEDGRRNVFDTRRTYHPFCCSLSVFRFRLHMPAAQAISSFRMTAAIPSSCRSSSDAFKGTHFCKLRFPSLFQLVSLSEFEKHAGSVARHPSDYIFLDDGRNLRQLVEEAQAVSAGKTLPPQEMVLWAPPEPATGGALGLEPAVEGACSACGEEGNVLKCSSCGREYHAGGCWGLG
jgi:hypothetical protein